jgi:hypothetical protein
MRDESFALNEKIYLLELKQADELLIMREQFYIAYESLKPINLIKNTFGQVISSPEIKNDLFSTIIGLSTGYLTRKIVIGGTAGPLKKVTGLLLQFAVTNLVSRHSEKIKNLGERLLTSILTKKREYEDNYHDYTL